MNHPPVTAQPLHKLALIGTGLIGGSFALALKKHKLVTEVVGYTRSAASKERALDAGVIDAGCDCIEQTVAGADLVFVATPVQAMDAVFNALSACLPENALVTDGGSVKQAVFARAGAHFSPDQLARFVPGHPIAGKERSGPEAAAADLFEQHRVILTPVADITDDAAVHTVHALWAAIGAEVESLELAEHDHLLAATSHLPHAAAFAMVGALLKLDERYDVFRYAAGGFRDFTRIASSDPKMWADIFRDNRDELHRLIAQYRTELETLSKLAGDADGRALFEYLSEIKRIRDDLFPPEQPLVLNSADQTAKPRAEQP